MVEAPARRVSALVKGLPAEAAVWRSEALPPAEELLAQLIERVDMWERAHMDVALRKKRFMVPAPAQIVRPGEEERARRIETDPRAIAAWFARAAGRG